MRTAQVKICGLTRREDVELAVSLGADYVGFVLVPQSKRYVPRERWRELTKDLPVKTVAVVTDPVPGAEEFFDLVQYHGEAFEKGWKALHLRSEADLKKLDLYRAERFVIDSAGGGSGVCCDWRLAALAARKYPVMLAGGLTPANVAEAVRIVVPLGVDVAGGVESAPGIKSEEKMKLFFKKLEQ